METRLSSRIADEPLVWFGIATGLVVATCCVAGVLHLGTTPTSLLAIGVGGVASSRLRSAFAPTLGVIAWAFFTGFFVNDYGQLTFAAHDVERLGGFTIATFLVAWFLRGDARPLQPRDSDTPQRRALTRRRLLRPRRG